MAATEEGAQVLSLTELGYGKRTAIEEYRPQTRGGKGIKAMNLTAKTGALTSQLLVKDDEDILLITDDGTVIRMAVKDIRESSRATQGVRLMRIAEGAKIVSVARAEQEQEEMAEEVLVEAEDPFATGDVEEQMASAEELADELAEEASEPMEDTDI